MSGDRLKFVTESERRYCAAQLHDLSISAELRIANHRYFKPLVSSSFARTSARRFSSHYSALRGFTSESPFSDLESNLLQSILEEVLCREGHWPDSKLMLMVAVELDPESALLRIALGAQHLDRGDCDGALGSFTIAKDLASNGTERSRALTNCAAAYERLNEVDLAIESSMLAIQQSPTAPLAVYNHRRLISRYLDPRTNR